MKFFRRGFNSLHLHFLNKNKKNIKRVFINNQIRAKEVRLIGEKGEQLGVLPLQEALKKAYEQKLDLIQVTEKAIPPVCRIGDYGKYLYSQKKKEKTGKQHSGEMKGVRLSFNISPHDMEIKAKAAKKFMDKGDKVRVEMRLRGREKALKNFAREKIQKFTEILGQMTPIKIEREIKSEPRGLTAIISQDIKK